MNCEQQVYNGLLDVKDGDFTLNVNRFIIRENEISFAFNGHDEGSSFEIHGIADKTEYGFYMARRIKLDYLQYTDEHVASVKICSVIFTEKKNRCHVKGIWIEDNEDYEFEGKLEIIKG